MIEPIVPQSLPHRPPPARVRNSRDSFDRNYSDLPVFVGVLGSRTDEGPVLRDSVD